MSTLHIVRTSAFSNNDLAQCLTLTTSSDTLVLIDDACYNVNHSLITQAIVDQPQLTINIMLTHTQARAIKTVDCIKKIEMKDLVALTFTHEQVITWQ